VTLVNVVLWVVGVALIAIGWQRGRGPWNRYQALREQDANAARYGAWRGGVRTSEGTTGASVAMAMLRRQVQIAAVIAVIGIALVVVGFAVR
jgi:small-conductance mechanosensitive channel